MWSVVFAPITAWRFLHTLLYPSTASLWTPRRCRRKLLLMSLQLLPVNVLVQQSIVHAWIVLGGWVTTSSVSSRVIHWSVLSFSTGAGLALRLVLPVGASPSAMMYRSGGGTFKQTESCLCVVLGYEAVNDGIHGGYSRAPSKLRVFALYIHLSPLVFPTIGIQLLRVFQRSNVELDFVVRVCRWIGRRWEETLGAAMTRWMGFHSLSSHWVAWNDEVMRIAWNDVVIRMA